MNALSLTFSVCNVACVLMVLVLFLLLLRVDLIYRLSILSQVSTLMNEDIVFLMLAVVDVLELSCLDLDLEVLIVLVTVLAAAAVAVADTATAVSILNWLLSLCLVAAATNGTSTNAYMTFPSDGNII